jgi:dienelactone hydrolase
MCRRQRLATRTLTVRTLLLMLGWWSACAYAVEPVSSSAPQVIVVPSGKLSLQATLWRPAGAGPFPAVLFNHGSGGEVAPEQVAALGTVFAQHGYVFLFLYGRGTGLSADQGTAVAELMRREFEAHGPDARDRLQLHLLDERLGDALAALAVLRALPGVDGQRVAVAGHSFGGMLALLLVQRDHALRAAVDFAGGALSWAANDPLRARLMDAVDGIQAPVFFIQADNDYSIAPSEALATAMLSEDKTRRIEIYPGIGRTPEEGHDFVYRGVALWEHDVFAFLDEHVGK